MAVQGNPLLATTGTWLNLWRECVFPTHHQVLLPAAACFNDIPPELLQREGAAAVQGDIGTIALGQTSSLQQRQERDVRQQTDGVNKRPWQRC